jgi:hypothetical protein
MVQEKRRVRGIYRVKDTEDKDKLICLLANVCVLFRVNKRSLYDLTHMQKVWDVPSNTQYNTSSNVCEMDIERSWWEL